MPEHDLGAAGQHVTALPVIRLALLLFPCLCCAQQVVEVRSAQPCTMVVIREAGKDPVLYGPGPGPDGSLRAPIDPNETYVVSTLGAYLILDTPTASGGQSTAKTLVAGAPYCGDAGGN